MKVTCPNCKEEVEEMEITVFDDKEMCEGCAETAHMMSSDDPHGRNWRPQ